jgi:hypothetical protein
MGRSTLAVIVGYLVIAIGVIAMFGRWFRSPEQVPTTKFMLFAVTYGFIAVIFGGYVTGLVARTVPVKHVLALVGICVLMAIVSFVAGGGRQPVWFQAANMVVMVSGVLLGG